MPDRAAEGGRRTGGPHRPAVPTDWGEVLGVLIDPDGFGMSLADVEALSFAQIAALNLYAQRKQMHMRTAQAKTDATASLRRR